MLADGTFEGRWLVVTGGGSGMGRAMALEFSRLGAAVVVAGRRPEPLAETAALIEGSGGRALAEPTDVRDPEQVDAMIARRRQLRAARLLVNNAAGNFVVKAEDLSPNGWRAVISIVLDGSFLCAQRGRQADDREGEGGAICRDRELRLDGRARAPCTRPRPRRAAGDDQDAGGGVGAARDPA